MSEPTDTQAQQRCAHREHMRFLRFGPLLCMAVLVTFLSLAPAYLFRDVESALPLFPGFDKCVHGLMYLVLTLSALYALPYSVRARICLVLGIVLAASVYGFLMEFCQSVLTATRSLDIFDMVANTAGAFLGAGVMWVMDRGWLRRG